MSAAPLQHAGARLAAKVGRVRRGVSLLLTEKPPDVVLTYGGGLGDDLLCTAVFHELKARGRRSLWMMSNHPELFAGNPDVDVVLPDDRDVLRLASSVRQRVVRLSYCRRVEAEDRDIPPDRHIIAEMCAQAGVRGEVSVRPYLSLSESEKAAGRILRRQVAIQSSGMNARLAMRDKEWFPERYQRVVTALSGEFDFVQVGAAGDPPLEGALDLRGQTSLRETAAILEGSLLFVGQVGLLMHLARAVECRSVIVYGGRELPQQTGYACNRSIATAIACSPCWRWNSCPYDRDCMRRIEPEAVAAAVRELAALCGAPLEVETTTI